MNEKTKELIASIEKSGESPQSTVTSMAMYKRNLLETIENIDRERLMLVADLTEACAVQDHFAEKMAGLTPQPPER